MASLGAGQRSVGRAARNRAHGKSDEFIDIPCAAAATIFVLQAEDANDCFC